ncbi:MAG: OmpH family outer membrane protein, partial [Alphaproteobacteria bacterium]|nr:OmpH family outer membrane protein [Alphaproteobacteria bacterium]
DEIAQRIFDLMVKIREISSQMTNQTMQIRQDKQLRQKQKQSKFTEMDKKWKILSTDYSKAMRKEKELDAKLTDYIQNKVLQVISDIAKKFKIDIVINKGSQNMTQVFYNTSNIDITNVVVNELNKIVPKIDLKEFE